jgi:hypothetical protein
VDVEVIGVGMIDAVTINEMSLWLLRIANQKTGMMAIRVIQEAFPESGIPLQMAIREHCMPVGRRLKRDG